MPAYAVRWMTIDIPWQKKPRPAEGAVFANGISRDADRSLKSDCRYQPQPPLFPQLFETQLLLSQVLLELEPE